MGLVAEGQRGYGQRSHGAGRGYEQALGYGAGAMCYVPVGL